MAAKGGAPKPRRTGAYTPCSKANCRGWLYNDSILSKTECICRTCRAPILLKGGGAAGGKANDKGKNAPVDKAKGKGKDQPDQDGWTVKGSGANPLGLAEDQRDVKIPLRKSYADVTSGTSGRPRGARSAPAPSQSQTADEAEGDMGGVDVEKIPEPTQSDQEPRDQRQSRTTPNPAQLMPWEWEPPFLSP